jgi:hypothetical protein
MRIFPAVLAAAFVIAIPSPARAGEGDVTWTVRTASNSFGADRSSFGYAVNPGGAVRDAMVVANRGKTPLTLAVYTADGFTGGTGQLDLRTRDTKAAGIGLWVKASPATITVPAGKTADVPFTVTIPANATPGDYVGGIVTSLTQADDQASVSVERRLGIRIKLRVAGALAPSLKIEQVRIAYDGSLNPFTRGDAIVSYTVHNTGNTTLSAQQAVAATGPFGWFHASTAAVAAPPELLPGESWPVKVPVHGVAPAFSLAATTTLTPLLTDASGTTTALKPIVVTGHALAVPWMLVVLLIVVLAAFVLVRRTAGRRKLAQEARVREAVEQALRERAG